MRRFRTSKFYGIYSFLWLVFIAHNLIVWFKNAKLKDSDLFDSGVKVLVKNCSLVKGFVNRTAQGINVMLEPLSKLSKLMLEALSEPDYVQLSFLV